MMILIPGDKNTANTTPIIPSHSPTNDKPIICSDSSSKPATNLNTKPTLSCSDESKTNPPTDNTNNNVIHSNNPTPNLFINKTKS